MPSWDQLRQQFDAQPNEATKLHWLNATLTGALQAIQARRNDRNVIVYASGFLQKPQVQGVFTMITMEDINGLMSVMQGMDCAQHVTLILHTPGGDPGAANALVAYLHSKFSDIETIVPTYAMSAGTMMCLGSNRIVMGRQSQLGPIDAQMLTTNGMRSAGVDITCFRVNAYQLSDRLLLDFNQIIPLREAEEFQVRVRDKQLVENDARRERVPWNGEFYANYGNDTARSWEDACKYGFISAGGGHWFTRTLNLLTPGARVWVNRPGVGYLGVGVVAGEPTPALDFMVDTKQGPRRYIDLDTVNEVIRGHADSPETMEVFVPIKWLATVPETKAIREPGLFGNQNSVAKPTVASWPHTIERLMDAFGLVG